MYKGKISIRSFVRLLMRRLAFFLNRFFKGHLTPNMVTYIGLFIHLPIALLIVYRFNFLAAIFLIVFGLFDTLDGELARLQKKDSVRGMLLDASTDRFKEVIIFSGIAYQISQTASPVMMVLVVMALGFSLTVSYVKAKGESAIALQNKSMSHQELNRLFGGGLLSFEVRMVVVIIGLILNQLDIAIIIIAIFAATTAVSRLIRISNKLT